jgi:hypothetical protein
LYFFAAMNPSFARKTDRRGQQEIRCGFKMGTSSTSQQPHYSTSRPIGEVGEAIEDYLKVIYQQLPGQIHENIHILEVSGSNPGAVYIVRLLAFVTRFGLKN